MRMMKLRLRKEEMLNEGDGEQLKVDRDYEFETTLFSVQEDKEV